MLSTLRCFPSKRLQDANTDLLGRLADNIKTLHQKVCRTCNTIVFPHSTNQIGHFRVHHSLHFKTRVSAQSLLRKSVFIHIEIRTNYQNKNFAFILALKERLRGTRKGPINDLWR